MTQKNEVQLFYSVPAAVRTFSLRSGRNHGW